MVLISSSSEDCGILLSDLRSDLKGTKEDLDPFAVPVVDIGLSPWMEDDRTATYTAGGYEIYDRIESTGEFPGILHNVYEPFLRRR